MLRGFAASVVGCLVVSCLWIAALSPDYWWHPLLIPLALSAAVGLVLLLWPGRWRVGVGAILGTVLAGLADYAVLLVIFFYFTDLGVT